VIQVPAQRLLLVPLALWMAHVAASFTIVEAHCQHGVVDGQVAGISSIRLLLLSVTGAALLALCGNGLAAARAWWATSDGRDDATGARSHLLLICVVASGIALLYLSWTVVFATEARLCR
jgi:hypothetical protein